MGDFNSRTGKYPDSICQDGNNIIANDQSEYSLHLTQRNSFDNELNNHGKKLLDICKSTDLRILNGRVNGDSLGRATFHGRNGISVIDYAICDQDLFSNISNFIVKEPSCLSDHSPIITWLNINSESSSPAALSKNDHLTRLPKQFFWENDSLSKFKDVLRSPALQSLIQEFINDDTPINDMNDVNTSLEKVENILTTTAKRCLKIKITKKHKRIKSSSNKKWFDKECRFKKHELRKLANKKHRDPLNLSVRDEYHTVLMQYKRLLNSKKIEYYNDKISELEDTTNNSDTTQFWKCLKSMDDTTKVQDIPLISEENWLLYFQSLHSNEPLNSSQQIGQFSIECRK